MSMDQKKAAELSAEELYALARQREKEEAERQKEERRKKREQLMEERKKMLARHRKELAELERQIRELGGRVGRAGGARRAGGGSVSQQLVEIIGSKPEMDTKEIKERAEQAGLDTRNISQTLAYLKRQGRLTSPRRGVYKSAS